MALRQEQGNETGVTSSSAGSGLSREVGFGRGAVGAVRVWGWSQEGRIELWGSAVLCCGGS